MIIVTIIILLAFYIVFPIMMNGKIINIPSSTASSYYDYLNPGSTKISDVIGFDSITGFILIMLLIGVGAILCTVCKRKEFISVGIITSVIPGAIFITQILSYLKSFNESYKSFYEVSPETIVILVLLAIVALYSAILGIVRLVFSSEKAKKEAK